MTQFLGMNSLGVGMATPWRRRWLLLLLLLLLPFGWLGLRLPLLLLLLLPRRRPARAPTGLTGVLLIRPTHPPMGTNMGSHVHVPRARP